MLEHMLTLAGLGFTTLASFASFLKSRQNSRMIAEVHLIINSRMTELLEETRAAAMYKERGEKEKLK